MKNKIDISSMNNEEIKVEIERLSFKSFRAKQIYSWLNKGVTDFNQMTNLSMEMREKLNEHFKITNPKLVDQLSSNDETTKKFLLQFDDKSIIECVLLKYKYGCSLCISTQVGCKMGCEFCASAKGGYVRNLTPGEMLAQVHYANKFLSDEGLSIKNIVVMGTGEPFDNYDNLLKFLTIVHDERGLNIGYRHITISTCGLVEKMIDFSKKNMPVTLSISLHSSTDQIRRRIMPIATTYSIKEIVEAAVKYIEKTGRRVTFEYALIKGVNDSFIDADRVSRLLSGHQFHVNIIPLNEANDIPFERPSESAINSFIKRLQSNGTSVTRRRELGEDIQGACGQLRHKYES